MKQKDLALIAIIVFISGIVSFLVTNTVFAPPKSRQQQVEKVNPITADFPAPSSKYFNNQSNDPTQLIQIGNSTNPSPFNGATQ